MANTNSKTIDASKDMSKNKKGQRKERLFSPGREAWIRLRKNKGAMIGLIVLTILVLSAIFADFITPYRYDFQDYNAFLQTPSLNHIFGTDNFGRDVFSRCIYGIRYSLPIGLISVFIATLVGGTLGAIAAFYGKKTDMLIMRFMDIYQSIPGLLLAIAIASALGAGMKNMILALGIGRIPIYARVVRGAIFTVKEKEFVEASRAIGAGNPRLIIKHLIPNCFGPIVVQMTFGVAAGILTAASLSYIGLGISPPAPEWGSMLNSAKQYLQTYPYLLVFPGIMITISVLSLNMLGDGLRDAFDPRLK